MKSNVGKEVISIVLIASVSLAVSACSTSKKKPADTNKQAKTVSTPYFARTTAPMPVGVEVSQVEMLGVPSQEMNGAYVKSGKAPFILVSQKSQPVEMVHRPWAIYFEFDSYKVDDSQIGAIQDMVAFLNLNPDQKVQITGYTDAEGTRTYNDNLARKRSMAVKSKMISQGLKNARQVLVSSFPETTYMASNTNVNGKPDHELAARNRRVTISLLSH